MDTKGQTTKSRIECFEKTLQTSREGGEKDCNVYTSLRKDVVGRFDRWGITWTTPFHFHLFHSTKDNQL